MTPNAYLASVLSKYALPADHFHQVEMVSGDLQPHIQRWAGQGLLGINRSGSFAKGTTIRGGTDLDLFVSIRSGRSRPLAQIYGSLYRALQQAQLAPRRQDVSIGLTIRGLKVDVVPARKHSGQSGDHSLYRQRTKTWTRTNIDRHISIVKGSGLQREIRALKVWRRLHGLEFPSIYLELVVLEAMKGRRRTGVAEHLGHLWNWIATEIARHRIVDPANSANIISNDLNNQERSDIAARATWSLTRSTWNEVLW